jgi:hypothetical protein
VDEQFLFHDGEFEGYLNEDSRPLKTLEALLQSWVQTCKADETPEIWQFAAIVVLPGEYDRAIAVRFCEGLVPVLQAFCDAEFPPLYPPQTQA